LVFALAVLTLVAITMAALAAEVRSRREGVVIEERSVRTIALADWAMAETLAELAANGAGFEGIDERDVPGGTISSRVRAFSTTDVEVVAVGRRVAWQTTITARVNLQTGPRVLRWARVQGPAPELTTPTD
jgi:hypothetical protein